MSEAIWKCTCGAVEARVPTTGARLSCYCESCREFVEKFDMGARLDEAGGSDLLQVAPDGVEFLKGTENLRWLRLSPKGPMRWYASCCGTPMANTLPTRAVAFASFQVHDIEPKSALPDTSAKVNLKGATAHVDGPLGSVRSLIFSLLGRTVKSWINGGWRRHAFFDAKGKPIATREDPVQSTG